MARNLNTQLLKELTDGKYKKLLAAVKQDPELTLEIRNNKAEIYHHRGLILTLLANKKNSYKELNEGYLKKCISKPQLDLQKPNSYLKAAKELVRSYKKSVEFAIQQNIATNNQNPECDYFIIDMEYAFPQNHLIPEQRKSMTKIDLVAIEKGTNDIVLFELKYGSTALSGKSGIDDHYEKTMVFIQDEEFCNILKNDIQTIIESKIALGLIKYQLPKMFGKIKMMYIYAYNNDRDLNNYKQLYAPKYEQLGVQTIYIDTRYKLQQ